jgi:hypothetical protein
VAGKWHDRFPIIAAPAALQEGLDHASELLC